MSAEVLRNARLLDWLRKFRAEGGEGPREGLYRSLGSAAETRQVALRKLQDLDAKTRNGVLCGPEGSIGYLLKALVLVIERFLCGR